MVLSIKIWLKRSQKQQGTCVILMPLFSPECKASVKDCIFMHLIVKSQNTKDSLLILLSKQPISITIKETTFQKTFTIPEVFLQLLEISQIILVQTAFVNSELTQFYPRVADKNQLPDTKMKNVKIPVKHQLVSWVSIDKKSISTNYRKKSLRTDLSLTQGLLLCQF